MTCDCPLRDEVRGCRAGSSFENQLGGDTTGAGGNTTGAGGNTGTGVSPPSCADAGAPSAAVISSAASNRMNVPPLYMVSLLKDHCGVKPRRRRLARKKSAHTSLNLAGPLCAQATDMPVENLSAAGPSNLQLFKRLTERPVPRAIAAPSLGMQIVYGPTTPLTGST